MLYRQAPKGIIIVPKSSDLIIYSKRAYTPIFSPEFEAANVKDHLSPIRLQDQLSLLWGASEPLVPSVIHGVQYLSTCGFDPVLQQLQLSSGTDSVTQSSSVTPEESRFKLFAEDYNGTNLSSPANKDHFRNSISYWTKIYEQKYSNTMRMFRRTASQHVGTANGRDVLEDEADLPQTPWSKDSYFRELTFIAANFLKEHCTSMEELEMKLRLASADAYLEFLNVFQYQTITMIPLPSSACWHYEGDTLKDWVERWRPLHLDNVNNFIPKLLKAARASEVGWPAVANKLADVFKAVYAVVEAREVRQSAVGGALRPLDDPTLSSDEKLAKATEIVGRRLKAYALGEFEPDDAADNSEEFVLEQIKIGELLAEPIMGLDFTAGDYWKHVVCCSEIEYEHLYASHTFKVLQAQALVQAKSTARSRQEYYSDIVASIRGSTLDMKNGNVIPLMNETWCKLNWVKYGASTLTHHTPAARRQLLFHQTSLGGVKAAATLHYKLQPLSSSLDYSTPYNFRRAYVNCCADYGVTMIQLEHQCHASSLMTVGKAEVLLSNITDFVKQAFGTLRRSEYPRKRAREERLLHDTDKKAKVLVLASLSTTSSDAVNKAEEHLWAFGTKRSVQFKYDSPLLQELSRMAGRSGPDAIFKEKELLHRAGAIEVCLMRKISPEVAKARASSLEVKIKDVAAVIASGNQFKLAFDHAVEYCKKVSSDVVISKSKDVTELNSNSSSKLSSSLTTGEGELEFVTMITDCASFPVPNSTQPQTLDVLLPYRTVKDFNSQTSIIPDGEYCLRLRFYDHTSNPQHDPTRCTEAFTGFFNAYNAIPRVISDALGMSEDASGKLVKNTMLSTSPLSNVADDISQQEVCVAGVHLIPLCNALRNSNIEVPLMVEFQTGQVLNDNGEFYLDVLVDLLTGGERFSSPSLSRQLAPINDGLTEIQLKLEPKIRKHWASLVFTGANIEEWYTMRRAVLNDAMDYELEWWRDDDWLDCSTVSIENFQTRLRHGKEVCNVLSARSDVVNGLDPRKMALPETDESNANRMVDEFETRAVLNGDGTVSSLSFNSDVVKQKNASVDQLLSAATDAISRASVRLNTLAAQKLDPIAHHATINTFLHAPSYSIFGGKYQATAGYALTKAMQELRMTDSSVEALRDLKPVDRFASKDHPEQRKVLWEQERDYVGVPIDDLSASKQSDWGV